MHYKLLTPSPVLAPFVKRYWMLEIDASDGNIGERVVPTGNISLMFHYKKPFEVRRSINAFDQQPQSIFSGISTSYFDVESSGDSGVIAVDFHPFGACNFFKFPLQYLQDSSIHLGDIFSSEIRFVEEQICESKSTENRIAIIEQFLISKFQPVASHDFWMIKKGIELIEFHGGQIQVANLAKKLMVTPKSLERKFSALVGKSPKQIIKIARFQQVMNVLVEGQPHYLTEYAYNNGYFDQSHFIKEFKSLSGYTPREFVQHCTCHNLTLSS